MALVIAGGMILFLLSVATLLATVYEINKSSRKLAAGMIVFYAMFLTAVYYGMAVLIVKQ